MLCVPLEGWDREGGREMQEGGDMGIYVYNTFSVYIYLFFLTSLLEYNCFTEDTGRGKDKLG